MTLPKQTKDIAQALAGARATQQKLNRDCLVKIFSTIRFLARQGLAYRGHGDNSESNFRQALILKREDDHTLLIG